MLFCSKGSCFYDRPNSLPLHIEPELFITLNVCGRFWGKIGDIGRDQPIKRTLVASSVVADVQGKHFFFWTHFSKGLIRLWRGWILTTVINLGAPDDIRFISIHFYPEKPPDPPPVR